MLSLRSEISILWSLLWSSLLNLVLLLDAVRWRSSSLKLVSVVVVCSVLCECIFLVCDLVSCLAVVLLGEPGLELLLLWICRPMVLSSNCRSGGRMDLCLTRVVVIVLTRSFSWDVLLVLWLCCMKWGSMLFVVFRRSSMGMGLGVVGLDVMMFVVVLIFVGMVVWTVVWVGLI